MFLFADSTLSKGKLLTNELRGSLFSLFSSWFSKTGVSPPVEKYVYDCMSSFLPTPIQFSVICIKYKMILFP